MRKLSRSFYDRDTLLVAQELLGKYLVHEVGGEMLIGKIVETEAYKGPMDKAAHSYSNKRTRRTEVMFGPPGYAYIFLIYGMYTCMNVVTEGEGSPCAVLIRAVEPVLGIEKMAQARFKEHYEELNKRQRIHISNGPGKLCKALQITMKQYGTDVCSGPLYICKQKEDTRFEVAVSKRINVDYAEEAAGFPWRYYIKNNPYVSVK